MAGKKPPMKPKGTPFGANPFVKKGEKPKGKDEKKK